MCISSKFSLTFYYKPICILKAEQFTYVDRTGDLGNSAIARVQLLRVLVHLLSAN